MRTVQIDLDILVEVVDKARIDAQSSKAWVHAINTAYDWLLQTDTVEMVDADTVRIPSATVAYRYYQANGSCQCTAYHKGSPCWHRAAARLVKRMLEVQEKKMQLQADVEAQADAEAQAARKAAREKAFREAMELFA